MLLIKGTFGTAILQVPVEGGHEGGLVKVEYKGREKMFENHQNSANNFYLSAFYNNCKSLMEPVTRGWKLALVYDLVWTNAKTLTPPNDLPVFLTAVKKIKAALSPWTRQKQKESTVNAEDNSHQQQIIPPNSALSSDEIDKSFSGINQEDSEMDQSSDEISDQENSNEDENSGGQSQERCDSDDGGDSSDENRSEEYDSDSITNTNCTKNVLFFVLQEKYEKENLLFSRLRGKDRDLARILQNCSFLDVHLAMVALKVSKQGGDSDYRTCHDRHCDSCTGDETIHRSVNISRWIDSANTIKELNIKFNWKEQCVGTIRNLLTSRGIEPDFEDDNYMDCGGTVTNSYYCNGILVIRPKYQSMLVYHENDIHPLLDRMEDLLSSTPSVLREEVHRDISSNLQQIIACYHKPQKDFKTDNNRSELMERLFRLCIVLRSRHGLDLLKMLESNNDGIQSAEVAKAIAEFECKVTGKKVNSFCVVL